MDIYKRSWGGSGEQRGRIIWVIRRTRSWGKGASNLGQAWEFRGRGRHEAVRVGAVGTWGLAWALMCIYRFMSTEGISARGSQEPQFTSS